ncbi:MAG: hypothetical protein DHS20C11_11460 [Lysobacteraceae bacterium]|nr:MAG: hypothetical protein DHS20C11_11460 [Xanthomonadaceae bacterium]
MEDRFLAFWRTGLTNDWGATASASQIRLHGDGASQTQHATFGPGTIEKTVSQVGSVSLGGQGCNDQTPSLN